MHKRKEDVLVLFVTIYALSVILHTYKLLQCVIKSPERD